MSILTGGNGVDFGDLNVTAQMRWWMFKWSRRSRIMGILRADRITGLGGANAIKGSVFF